MSKSDFAKHACTYEPKGKACIPVVTCCAPVVGCRKTLQVITLIWTLLRQGPAGKPAAKRVIVVTPCSLTQVLPLPACMHASQPHAGAQ
jgi:hypothetical protein